MTLREMKMLRLIDEFTDVQDWFDKVRGLYSHYPRFFDGNPSSLCLLLNQCVDI
jgi:predicted AAA+ superfamily ATPase